MASAQSFTVTYTIVGRPGERNQTTFFPTADGVSKEGVGGLGDTQFLDTQFLDTATMGTKKQMKAKKGRSKSIPDIDVESYEAETILPTSLPSVDSVSDLHEVRFRASGTETTFPGYLAALRMKNDGSSRSGICDSVVGGNSTKSIGRLPKIPKGASVWLSAVWFNASSGTSTSDDLHADGQSTDHDHDIALELTESVDSSNIATNSLSNHDDAPNTPNSAASCVLRAPGLRGIAHTTRPPARFNEASFIRELENVGVGRPSTYSKILQVLKEREYIIVDGRSIIPTVKGLVVDALMEKHFKDIVSPDFTSYMEDQLDQIASGTRNKLAFLSSFYLGQSSGAKNGAAGSTGTDSKDSHPDTSNDGLLYRVSRKLFKEEGAGETEIDYRESRSLQIPQLQHLGSIQLGRSGLFFVGKSDATESMPLKKHAAAAAAVAAAGGKPGLAAEDELRWKMSPEMEVDLRLSTPDAVAELMTQVTATGELVGQHPETSVPVLIRSSKFGRYLQIGSDVNKKPPKKSRKKNDDSSSEGTSGKGTAVEVDARQYVQTTVHALPSYVNSTFGMTDVLAFASLPLVLGNHSQLLAPIALRVKSQSLCVGLLGHPHSVPLPDGTLVSDVTYERACGLLADVDAILDSQRVLGEWDDTGDQVYILKGKLR